MPTFEVTAPDGKVYEVTAPEGATETQIIQYAQSQIGGKTATPRVNKDIEAGRAKPGWQQGLASVANGPLLGFADEIGGAIGGAIDYINQKPRTLSDLVTGSRKKSFGELYQSNRDTLRGMQQAQAEENPIFTAVTQGMASAPLSMIGALGKANTLYRGGPSLLQAAKTGMGYGAAGAAGASTSETPLGVAADTALGGVTGAVLGPVTQVGMQALGAVASNIASRVRESQAVNKARQKVAEALARDARGEVFTSGAANPANQVSARLGKMGPEATIADVGGQNTMQLLDTMATLPGRTKQAVSNVQRERMATEGGRLRDAASTALDTGGQRLSSTIDSLITNRATAADPLYAQLRRVNLNPSQDLVDVVATADALGAIKHARTMATARQQPFTIDPANPGSWNAGQLDHVKRGLDQLISKETKPDGSVSPVGAAYTELRGKLVNLLDNATTNPRTGESLYQMARNAYAGPSALIDAAKAGRKILSSDDVAISSALEGFSTSEREAFRIGAYEALHTKLGTQAGRTELMNLWKNDSTREKLQAVFGENIRSYREFAAALTREREMRAIQKVDSGSQTAKRLAGMQDIDNEAIADVAKATLASKLNPLTAISALQANWGRISTPQPVRDQIGQLLLSKGPQANANLLNMQSTVDLLNRNNALYNNQAGLLGGSLIGSQLAPRGLIQ